MSLDVAARAVVARYPALAGTCAQPLGNHGGFSGARLWRLQAAPGEFCLRAWPPSERSAERLRWIHGLMTAARELRFIPRVVPTMDGATHVCHAERLWDVTSWLPGQADFHERPTAERLAAACIALAQIHRIWETNEPSVGPCPAVIRRLEGLDDWTRLLRSDWRPMFGADDVITPWAKRAWEILQRPPGAAALTAWLNRSLPLQPCLCDAWHDHVLFDGDVVAGLIDFGSVKRDNVAVDLARLLGSLVGNNRQQWHIGLSAYDHVRRLSLMEEELVDILDVSGTWLGAANWLKWLYHERRHYGDRDAVARRLAALVERMEHHPV